jgi:hypothetical protein
MWICLKHSSAFMVIGRGRNCRGGAARPIMSGTDVCLEGYRQRFEGGQTPPLQFRSPSLRQDGES